MRPYQIGINSPSFNLKSLQRDINCVAIQDPSQVWGAQDFLPRRNLLTYSEDYTNAAWTKRGTCSVTTGQSDPWGTTKATKLEGIGTGGVNDIYYKVGTTTTSGVLAGFWFNKVSTSGTLRVINGNGGSNGTWLIDLSAVQSGWVFVTQNTPGVTVSIPFTYALNGGYGPLFSCTAGAPISFYLSGVMVCSADTLDPSYQRVTDWTTEQYTWAAQKPAPWLRRNRFLSTATLSTQTVSSVTASPITVSFKGTGTVTFSTAYSGSLVGTGANDRVTTTFTPSAGNLVCTVTGTVTEAQCENGSVATEYQPILADWDATYTANAIAAGYPIALWQDSAGTKAVNGDNQAMGACRDLKYGDYGAEKSIGNNLSAWSNGSNTTHTDTSFTTTGSAIGVTLGGLEVGKVYRVACYGSTNTAEFSINTSDASNPTASTSLLVGFGSCVFTAISGRTYLYLRNSTAGTTTINYISLREIQGYTAIQATTANQPKWRLDANGKALVERDGVNDAMPITLPDLGSNCAVYVGEGATVSESLNQTLNGSYAPTTPAKDYGRVIFQLPTSNTAKVIKWLKAKAGY